MRIEIDTNHDGVLDRWEYYRADGQLEKVGSSRRQDGSPDSWAYYGQGGSIARLELATHPGGTVDRIEHYGEGAIVRAEEDTTGDGRIDKWEVYDGSRLASVAFDTAERGYPDHRLVYSADGSDDQGRSVPLTRRTVVAGPSGPGFLTVGPPLIRKQPMGQER